MAGIINGLFSGRSGIQAHGSAISVLADNIANSNTTAYKASRPDFTDLLAASIGGGGGALATGNGSNLGAVTQVFTQGTFEFTGRGLDIAIDGNGFFIVEDEGTRLYTRAGNLKIDADGNLLDQNGNTVLGFPADGSGGLEALSVNDISQSSVRTTAVEVAGNLDASAEVTTRPPAPTSFSQLADDASFSTFVDVFDSLGAKHTVTIYFFKTAPGEWEAAAYVDGGETTGGAGAGEPELLGSAATIEFNSSGGRDTIPAADITASPTWSSGADDLPITFLFDPMSQFSAASAINSIVQDGSGTGSVVSFSVEQDGTLFALLNNGQTASVGTIALANFANPEGLQRLGNSMFVNTTNSGEPIVGTPSTGQFGIVQSGALELSTADIANDFVKLISLQRGFQGSSRIISSINDLMNEIVNLAG